MKITRSQLSKIIKEELEECMSDLGMLGGDAPFAGKTISLSLGKKAKKKRSW